MDTRTTNQEKRPGETGDETMLMGDAILDRARTVGERITARCRRVTGDALPVPDDRGEDQKS